MRHRSVPWGVLLLAVAASVCGAKPMDTAHNLPADFVSFREPALRIPQAKAVFRADAEIAPAERAACAELRQFVTFQADAQGDDRMTVYLAHTGAQLYVAFRIRRIATTTPEATATERDSRLLWKEDDSVEIRILTPHGNFDLIGNSAGTCGDANRVLKGTNIPWSHDGWQYAARVTDDGWQGEFLVPAEFFGVDAFQPGETWRMDVFNNAKTDVEKCGWAYLAGLWHFEPRRFPRVTFGGAEETFQSAQQLGAIGERRIGLTTELRNPSGKAREVRTWASFFRLRDGEDERSYYESLKGVLEPGGIEILPGATYEELVQYAVADFLQPYVQAGVVDEAVTIPAGETWRCELRKPDLPGTYLVAWRYADADSADVLSAGAYPFSINPPLNTELEYHYLAGQEIILRTRISEAIGRRADVIRYLVARGEEAVASRDVADFARGKTLETVFSTAAWPAGDYVLTVTALDGKTVVSEKETPFRKPEPPFWWQNDAGKQIQVSWPWTPVEATDRTTDVWGRAIRWKNGPLPERIVSQEQELLVRPPRLVATLGGSGHDVACTAFELASARPDVAEYAGTARIGQIEFKTRTSIEFDGMMRFDWTLTPAQDRPAKLDGLFLDLPIRKDVAELLSADGVRHCAIGDEPIALPFSPSVVVRNSRIGIEWFAECQQHWSNADENRLIDILPGNDTVILRIRFVDAPVLIDAPRTITFGLIAWPVKPWPKQRFNLSNYLGSSAETKAIENYDQWDDGLRIARRYGLNLVEWFHWNGLGRIPDYPEFYNQEIEDRVRNAARGALKNGIPIMGHTGFAMPTDVSDFEYYGMEMVRHPLINCGRYGYKFTATPVYTDAYVARFKKVAEETGWSGFQSDGGLNPAYSENERCGFAWRDARGKLRGRWPISAYRELTRRLHNVFHGEVHFPGLPNGFGHITLHNYHAYGAVHGFVDSFHTGESRESWGSFHTLDIEGQRARYASRSFGVPLLCLPKLTKATHGGRGRLAFALLFNMNPLHNRILQHLRETDYRKTSYPAHRVWDALAWADARPENLHGYWENSDLISFDRDRFYSTIYLQHGDKLLLHVVNWLPEDRTVTATLNLANLGLADRAITVEDAITAETVPAADGKITLDVHGDGYRLLKIAAAR